MAISIVSFPQLYTPGYNDQYFVCTSDNIGEVGFNYIFDIYINSALVTRHRIAARPSDGYGIFNPTMVLESYISNDPLSDLDTDFINHANSFIKYVVKIGEEYDVSGVSTIDPDLYTSSAIYAINASLQYLEFIDWDYTDYQLGSSSKKFLTNSPSNKVQLGERVWLYTLNTTTANYSKRIIKTYDSSGSLLDTFTATNSITSATDANRFLRTSVGPYHVLQQHGSTALDDVAYYTVEIQTAGNSQISEAKRFDLVESCKYTPVRIHFLNKLGGFDSFTFTKVSQEDSDISRTGWTKGQTETITSRDRYTTVSSVKIKDKLVVNSDWISEEESIWLKELITSPVIFQELNDRLIAINCKTTNYSLKKSVNEKVFNLRAEFEYTYENFRQRY